MRIVQVCPYAWDAPGGVQVHVRQLTEHLMRRGHDLLVLAPADGPAGEPWVRIVGRPVRVPYQGTVAPICLSFRSARRIRAALRSFGPEVVHAHEPLAPSTSLLATLRSPVPVVATFHAFAERSVLFDVAAPFLGPVWRRLAGRVAVSEAARTHVASRLGDRIRVVPNGVDLESFAAARPSPGLPPGRRVLWVGRLDPQKGFPVAIRAFGELAGEFPEATLIVAGDGRDRAALADLPVSLRTRVVMLGAVPHERLPSYHAASDVFVSAALGQESFGVVLAEAMAAGLPVVASDIPGYREVVRAGVDGLLVPPGDAGALARAVRRILRDAGLARRLSDAGRERARAFAWPSVIDRLEETYREAARLR